MEGPELNVLFWKDLLGSCHAVAGRKNVASDSPVVELQGYQPLPLSLLASGPIRRVLSTRSVEARAQGSEGNWQAGNRL